MLDYLQSSQSAGSDNMLNALMMRHRTLSATNEQCVDNLALMVDEVRCVDYSYWYSYGSITNPLAGAIHIFASIGLGTRQHSGCNNTLFVASEY